MEERQAQRQMRLDVKALRDQGQQCKIVKGKIVDPDGMEIPRLVQVPIPAVAPDTGDKNPFPELGTANKDPTAGANNKDSPQVHKKGKTNKGGCANRNRTAGSQERPATRLQKK